jgi:hypothetical protein
LAKTAALFAVTDFFDGHSRRHYPQLTQATTIIIQNQISISESVQIALAVQQQALLTVASKEHYVSRYICESPTKVEFQLDDEDDEDLNLEVSQEPFRQQVRLQFAIAI